MAGPPPPTAPLPPPPPPPVVKKNPPPSKKKEWPLLFPKTIDSRLQQQEEEQQPPIIHEQLKDEMDLQPIFLEEREDLWEKSAIFLNFEWPRSIPFRFLHLEKSKKTYSPSSSCSFHLALVASVGGEEGKKEEEVVGHVFVGPVGGQKDVAIIESVLVHGSLRRRGIGKKVMVEAEKEAQRRGFKKFYLYTDDMAPFYATCDYIECDPLPSVKNSRQDEAATLSSLFGGRGGTPAYVWMCKSG